MSTTTTNAQGKYSDCGFDQPVAVTVTCGGPSCAGLNSQFPDLTCTSDATTGMSNCNNGVTCPGQVSFSSIFALAQVGSTVKTSQNVTVDGQTFSGVDPGSGGTVSYSTVGTAVATPTNGVCPAAASTPVLFTSSGNRTAFIPRRRYPSVMFILVMVMSLFITQINAQSPSGVVSQINGLFPAGHQALLAQVEQSFCEGSVFP